MSFVIQPSSNDLSLRKVVIFDWELDFCDLEFNSGACSPGSYLIEGFEIASEWVVANNGINLAENTTTYLQGSRSIQVDKSAGGTNATVRKAALANPIDFTQFTECRMAYYIPNSATLAVITTLRLSLAEDAGFTILSRYEKSSGLVVGWNFLSAVIASPTSTAGSPTRTAVTGYQMAAITGAAGDLFTAPVIFDDLIVVGTPGAHCYKTRSTCQDASHYRNNITTKTYRFTMEDGPIIKGLAGPTIVPCIRKDGIKLIGSKIDQERGLGARDNMEIQFVDFKHDDEGVDPYRNLRSQFQGTYWPKFIARNKYVKGRRGILREGYGIASALDPPGCVRVDLTQFSAREYYTESLDGPDANSGGVKLVAKDPLFLLDGVLIPEPSEAELLEEASAVTTTWVLGEDQAAALLEQAGGVLPFKARAGNEIVLVEAISGDNLTVQREMDGSDPEVHAAESKVQYCEWFNGVLPNVILDRILEDYGEIATSIIDTAGNTTEVDTWMTDYSNLYAVISQPTPAQQILSDLCQQTSSYVWWDAWSQLIRFRHLHPQGPTETRETFTDSANIAKGTLKILPKEDKRINAASFYYGVINWAEDFGKDKGGNYLRQAIHIDVDAIRPDEYDDLKIIKVFAYFIPAINRPVAQASAARLVARFRDAPKEATFCVTEKDVATDPGDVIDLDTYKLVDQFGANLTSSFFVVGKRYVRAGGIQIELMAESFVFSGRYAYWNTETPPASYSVATEAQKRYAFWCNEAETVNGDAPYRWV